jgi:hypothetical protein
MRTTLVALCLLAAGCAGANAFRALPQADRDAWDSCWTMVRGRSCNPQGGMDGVYADVCMRDVAQRYAELPSAADRRVFLVEAGPLPVVAQYLDAS